MFEPPIEQGKPDPGDPPEPRAREPEPPRPGTSLPQPYVPLGGLPALRQGAPAWEAEEDQGLSWQRYLQILLRRKWLVLAVAVTTVFLAALQVLTATPLYQASARIQIDPETSRILPYEEVGTTGPHWWDEGYFYTQAEKLRTRVLALRVVRALDLTGDRSFSQPVRPGLLKELRARAIGMARRLASLGAGAPAPEPPETASESATAAAEPAATDATSGDLEATPRERSLAGRLLGGLGVDRVQDTRLLRISFTSPSPVSAARVANGVADQFIEQHLESKYQATLKASEFLERQLKELQSRVERSEEALLRYAREKNIVNLSERENLSRARLSDLNQQLNEAEAELINEQARYEAAQSATVESLPAVLRTETMRLLETRISEAEGRLAGLSARYGVNWPEVREARQELDSLRQQFLAEKRNAIATARENYRLAADRFEKLSAAAADQRLQVDRLNEDSIQYSILKRESDSNKDLYEGLLQRLKEAGVAAGLKSSNIQVVDRAQVPGSTSYPRKTRSLTLALVLGLSLGVGAAFLVETLDNTVKTTDDVTNRLGLPALGLVPRLPALDQPPRRRLSLRRPRSAEGPVVAFDTSRRGASRALEALRSLRTSLLLSHSGKPPQVILVSSALPSEGKSTVAANLAISLAQTGVRTLLMDLDMRRPSLASIFGLKADRGMSTFLSGNSDLSSQIHQTTFANVFMVPAGLRAPNPGELIGSRRMAQGMQLAREYFTYVVVDTPPSLEISDALVLSPYVDGVVLVVQGDRTPRQVLRKAADQFLNIGATLLGVVINNVDVEQRGYGYYYGYYGYGSYGDYYERPPEAVSKKTA